MRLPQPGRFGLVDFIGPNCVRGPGNVCSLGLGPGPIPAFGHPRRDDSKRRCAGVGLKTSITGPGGRRRRPPALTLLPLSNFQRSRTAIVVKIASLDILAI